MEAEPEREGQRATRTTSKKASVGTAAFFGLVLIVNVVLACSIYAL